MRRFGPILAVLAIASAAGAADGQVSGSTTIYVTKADCDLLVQHTPQPGVAYQPGVDVHGKYVAPADLPSSAPNLALPSKLSFDVRINPLDYGGGATSPQASKFANTQVPVAHVDVDLMTGKVRLNGQPLDGAENEAILAACRKAGYR